MDKHSMDIVYFISFCIEQYKMHIGKGGSETAALFKQYGVTDYLVQCFDVLHTQSRQWLMADIDEFIKNRQSV